MEIQQNKYINATGCLNTVLLDLCNFVGSGKVLFSVLCFSVHSTLRQCLVQMDDAVLRPLVPRPQHELGRGSGYVKQCVD
jgi:hypothetical protein